MEEYASEQEQVDELKKLLRENAPWAIGGVILGALLYFGYTQYQTWLDQKAHTGAQKYELVLDALSKKDVAEANKQFVVLQSDYSRSPFADQAALALARFDVEGNDWDNAKKHLSYVIDNSRDAALKEVALLNLARVERAMGQREQALKTLDKAAGGRDGAAISELRGDVLADSGKVDQAREAYEQALKQATNGIVDKELIELKLNALAGSATAEKK
jgi:predicted negative regulator of RcsB-dependent stress response